jgi:hypothetical protein
MTPEPAFPHFDEEPEKKPAPDLSPAEVMDSRDFEHKLDEEWQSTREAYQERISSIMDDFLTKGLDQETPEPPPSSRSRGSGVSRDALESAVRRMAQEMRNFENRQRAAAATAPLALPAPARKPRTKWIAGAIVALAVIAGLYGIWSYQQVGAYTPLPYARTGAVLILDGKIYIADWLKKSLYVHAERRGAPILSVEGLSSELLTGLAANERGMWTTDGLTNEIARRAKTPDHSVVEKFKAPADRPEGLVIDRDAMWTTAGGKLYRLRSDDPSDVVEKFAIPGVSVTALQMRDRRLWALDGKAREIAVFRLQKDLKPLATLDLDPFLRGGTPTGLAIQGSDAWIVTENPAAIVRVPLRKLKKSRQSEF